MNLIDSVALSRTRLLAHDPASGRLTALNSTADLAAAVVRCPLRYVMVDDLTRLCADLAYSKGARAVACADLLHVPAEAVWVEWCRAPWKRALQDYGFTVATNSEWLGRHGVWVRASRDGRRGLVRAFWSGAAADVLASSLEAYFDFDTPAGEEPEPFDGRTGPATVVYESKSAEDDILQRCFRFRHEQSWAAYYGSAGLSDEQKRAVCWHTLGSIALSIPMLVVFFLLLATRGGLPQHAPSLEHLNRRRLLRGKGVLLDHIEVRAPIMPEYRGYRYEEPRGIRASPRLHHVRGHLVRRGSQIHWRVPHLRGCARSGVVRARTVTWTFDAPTKRDPLANSRNPISPN